MENKELNTKVEETKETKWEKVKTFGKKIKKTAIKVGVVVLAFGAGVLTDALIRGKKDASAGDGTIPELPSGDAGCEESNAGEEENNSEENVTEEQN